MCVYGIVVFDYNSDFFALLDGLFYIDDWGGIVKRYIGICLAGENLGVFMANSNTNETICTVRLMPDNLGYLAI